MLLNRYHHSPKSAEFFLARQAGRGRKCKISDRPQSDRFLGINDEKMASSPSLFPLQPIEPFHLVKEAYRPIETTPLAFTNSDNSQSLVVDADDNVDEVETLLFITMIMNLK